MTEVVKDTTEAVGESVTDSNLVDSRPQMEVKVYAPFQIYYEGTGYSVSAINDVGPFDILPMHKNFLCMLAPCDLKVQTPDGDKIIPINRALMHVKADRVVVFVNV